MCHWHEFPPVRTSVSLSSIFVLCFQHKGHSFILCCQEMKVNGGGGDLIFCVIGWHMGIAPITIPFLEGLTLNIILWVLLPWAFLYKLIGIKACIILLSEVLPLTSGSKHSFRCFESVLLKSELVRELLLVTQVSLSTHITTPHWVYLHFHSQSTKVLRAPHPPMWPSLQEPTFVWTLEPRVCASPGPVFLPGSYCLRVPWSLLTRFFSLLIILSWLELDLKQPFCWLLFFF